MASARNKKPCVKCPKNAGIATCGGCQAWFCTKHFIEHRQGLGEAMERIGQQHDDLHKDLDENNIGYSLLSQINAWEQTSLSRIQEVAEKARTDLAKYIDEAKTQLTQSLNKIKNELASSRASDDFTEIELKQWNAQLEKLGRMLEKPPSIDIVEDDQSQSFIRIIQRKGI
ncbi:unnamed protein product [Rotaria magnacalcarata]|uniref:Uncharacterized protein n=2 Tax=Rotaria magnacalcarata TaxID=392030 RepID=A0A816NIP7_9BILA|nr:unnamed protein product [Rotaria magnacalcarata]CAF1370738.1 unnamed protein product [Rotaria magnacalcarata]CAF2033476.1 unnamed protein product [Rotaria magnacalcarata]CAF4061374.1 unnamed protein product [Rotaria magnacalcarata]CAF4102923.1 unnamed protein product [Rotaria magnacalcarata]